jgi:hypothetical protein
MPKKSPSQIEEEHRRRRTFRQKLISDNPDYRREFEESLRTSLMRKFPGHSVDSLMTNQDERRWFCESWPPEAFDLSKKWNILRPWDPLSDELLEIESEGPPASESKGLAEPEEDNLPEPGIIPPVRVINFQDSPISLSQIRKGIIKLSKLKFINGERNIRVSGIRQGASEPEVIIDEPMKIRRLADFTPRRYLLVEIDLHNPKQQIRHLLRRLIDHYWKRINPPKSTRARGPSYDDFCLIVDEMRMAGQNFAEITRELFPETRGKNLNNDPSSKSLYERVKRAFKKAKKLKTTPS